MRAERVAPSKISFHKGLVDNGHAPSALARRKRVSFVEIAPGNDYGSERREEPGRDGIDMNLAIRGDSLTCLIVMRLFLVPLVSCGAPAIADIRVALEAQISS